MQFLNVEGIETKIHYPVPLHLQPAAKNLGYRKGDFPIAEKQSEMVLALPHHQHLTYEQIQFVADKINEFYHF